LRNGYPTAGQYLQALLGRLDTDSRIEINAALDEIVKSGYITVINTKQLLSGVIFNFDIVKITDEGRNYLAKNNGEAD